MQSSKLVRAVRPCVVARSGQRVQFVCIAALGRGLKVLAVHAVCCPREHQWPGAQSMQAVAPGASWYLPVSQRLHSSCRSRSWYVPVEHGCGTTLPMMHACPRSQSVQSAALARLVLLPNVMLGQGCGTDEPGIQNEPGVHRRGCSVPPGHHAPPAQMPEHHGPDCSAGMYELPCTPPV